MRGGRPCAFLFDLDGTLLDSAGDIADAANAALLHLGLPPLPEAAIARHVGWGLGHLLRHILPAERLASQMEAARAAFVAHYQAHPLDRSRPFPGATACLDALRAAGRPVGLVTNKPARFLGPVLEGLGWSERFDVVLGGGALPTRKPAPEPLLHALAILGIAPARALYVGDSEVDLQAAAAAAVRFVAVGWGRVAAVAPESIGAFSDLLG